jgi:hypothetical protein
MWCSVDLLAAILNVHEWTDVPARLRQKFTCGIGAAEEMVTIWTLRTHIAALRNAQMAYARLQA